jgi:hypothetical protein
MNMNHNPTPEQLAALLGACDDTADHHVLWAAKDGEVRVTPLGDQTPAAFGERPDLQFRYETYGAGNGYVGPAVAADEKQVKKLFDELARDWRDGRQDYLD